MGEVVLVDSSVWIDYFNGIQSNKTDILDDLLHRQLVITGDIILTEILQGFIIEDDFKTAKNILNPLDCMQLGGKSLAVKAASNFRFLRSKGITIRKTVDMLIGSWCIKHEIELLHKDRDFDQIALHLPLKMCSF
jgi:predicted nucleic acid-binding protein